MGGCLLKCAVYQIPIDNVTRDVPSALIDDVTGLEISCKAFFVVQRSHEMFKQHNSLPIYRLREKSTVCSEAYKVMSICEDETVSEILVRYNAV